MDDHDLTCSTIEPGLIAAAAEEAMPLIVSRIDAHLAACGGCRQRYERYRGIERMIGELKGTPIPQGHLVRLREDLATRLAELRRRLIRVQTYPSPLGRVLIGASEEGIVLVEYLNGARGGGSRLGRRAGLETIQDDVTPEPFYRQLLEYLGGHCQRLGWPLDLRLTASDFQRDVLKATAELPYGAVTSYGRIARQLGLPRAVRAVAQALRGNPLPIVVPCHRVVGSGGALTGYAGNQLALKMRLLATEGVPLTQRRTGPYVQRAAMYTRAGQEDAYCLPTCGALASLTLARLTLYATREGAEACGLHPCHACRPDLNPLAAGGRAFTSTALRGHSG